MGLVVALMALELLFSWGSYSGYNNSANAFPIGDLLNYLLIPPSIWLFIKYNMDDNFKLRVSHLWLYLPAAFAYLLVLLSRQGFVFMQENTLWFWFSDYLPLGGLIFVCAYFWVQYVKLYRLKVFHTKPFSLSQIKLLLMMLALTLLGLSWLIFSFIGWSYFHFIEYTLVLFFNLFAFIHFLEGRTFPVLNLEEKHQEFPNYDDQKSLKLIEDFLATHQPFLKPNYPLKDLARDTGLPVRYVSFLINHYQQKNYKEFINQFRIETFLLKASSNEKNYKTLLGLALESGFSSKSTFNQVFKSQVGKSPSEYLG